jgi:hypothetical protein
MAETHNNRRQGAMGVSGTWAFDTNATPRYQHGDYLLVELLSGSTGSSMPVWMYVDHCDDKHAIVFGTIDSEPSEWVGSPLTRGAKVAVSYRQVREHRQSW